MTIQQLAEKIIKDGHALLRSLLRVGNIDDFSIDTVDNIIIAAHHIKEKANEGIEGQAGQRIEENEEGDPGYHIL